MKGGFATLTFQVLNEERTNTTKVQVKFPDDNPIADAGAAGRGGRRRGQPPTPPVTTDEHHARRVGR
jgi:hypothetical protein